MEEQRAKNNRSTSKEKQEEGLVLPNNKMLFQSCNNEGRDQLLP